MRSSHVATALAAVTAGFTAAVALHRRADRRPPAPATAPAAPLAPVAVVLPFVRPVVTAPVLEQPVAPARCGDNGGRTKAGAPCAARPTTGGRCYHHPIAA